MIDTGCQVTISWRRRCLNECVPQTPGFGPASSMWTRFDIGGFVSFDGAGSTGYDCCFSGTEMRYGVGGG